MDGFQQLEDPQKAQVDKILEQINDRLAERGPIIVEPTFEETIGKLTDTELAARAMELKAKIDAHMQEMARRLCGYDRPKK